MSTLADELLQDFEDSGSEGDEQQNAGLFPDNEESNAAGVSHATDGRMELDGDEEDAGEDEEMAGANGTVKDVEDEEETKAKVEKMQLGGVDDVRSVAGLMKTLEPVLEVSVLPLPPLCLKDLRFTNSPLGLALTALRLYRKSHTINLYPRRSRPRWWAPLKTIQSIIF